MTGSKSVTTPNNNNNKWGKKAATNDDKNRKNIFALTNELRESFAQHSGPMDPGLNDVGRGRERNCLQAQPGKSDCGL